MISPSSVMLKIASAEDSTIAASLDVDDDLPLFGGRE